MKNLSLIALVLFVGVVAVVMRSANEKTGRDVSVKYLTTLQFSEIKVVDTQLGTSTRGDDQYLFTFEAINASGKKVTVQVIWSERFGARVVPPPPPAPTAT